MKFALVTVFLVIAMIDQAPAPAPRARAIPTTEPTCGLAEKIGKGKCASIDWHKDSWRWITLITWGNYHNKYNEERCREECEYNKRCGVFVLGVEGTDAGKCTLYQRGAEYVCRFQETGRDKDVVYKFNRCKEPKPKGSAPKKLAANTQCSEGSFIGSKAECDKAAAILGLADTSASIESASIYEKVPRGCFWAWGALYFNPTTGNGLATSGREPICFSGQDRLPRCGTSEKIADGSCAMFRDSRYQARDIRLNVMDFGWMDWMNVLDENRNKHKFKYTEKWCRQLCAEDTRCGVFVLGVQGPDKGVCGLLTPLAEEACRIYTEPLHGSKYAMYRFNRGTCHPVTGSW